MATFERIVELALTELAQVTADSAPTAEEIRHGMDVLIYWLDQESISGLMQETRERPSHEFDGADRKLRWEIGAGREIPFDLPAQLEQVLYKLPGDAESRPIDQVSLDSIARHADAESGDPLMYGIEKGSPFGVIHLDAAPGSGDRITFVGSAWLTVDAETARPEMEIGLPRGYERTLYLGLAIELAPAYGVQIDRETRERSRDAMSKIKYRNVEPSQVRYDKALTRFRPRQI